MQERASQSQPPSIISSLKELAVGHFHSAENGGTGRYQVSTGRSTPCVRCSGVGHMSFFESHASVSNGYLRTTRHGQVSTGRVRYSPDPSQRVLQTVTSPDLEHRTVRCSPDLSAERVAKPPHTGRTPPDAPRAPGALKQTPSVKTGLTGPMNKEHPASGAVRLVLNPSRVKH